MTYTEHSSILTFDKARLWPVGHGYSARTGEPGAVIVHATHGRRGTSLRNEALFLVNSPDVSAHYLIGRAGEVLPILDPRWCAWHAGQVRPGWSNNESIGIELHAAASEPITPAQRAALADLLTRALLPRYGIPLARVETHRAVALPRGRKSDPGGWPQPDFLAWRASLAAPLTTRYRCRYTAYVRAEPTLRAPRVETLLRESLVEVSAVVAGERIEHASYGTSSEWADVGYGYIWLPQLEAL